MQKLKDFVKNICWNIKSFILQPIIPTKTIEWVKINRCSYSGESANGKYLYYWYGNFKSGYQVKVKKEWK